MSQEGGYLGRATLTAGRPGKHQCGVSLNDRLAVISSVSVGKCIRSLSFFWSLAFFGVFEKVTCNKRKYRRNGISACIPHTVYLRERNIECRDIRECERSDEKMTLAAVLILNAIIVQLLGTPREEFFFILPPRLSPSYRCDPSRITGSSAYTGRLILLTFGWTRSFSLPLLLHVTLSNPPAPTVNHKY